MVVVDVVVVGVVVVDVVVGLVYVGFVGLVGGHDGGGPVVDALCIGEYGGAAAVVVVDDVVGLSVTVGAVGLEFG